MYIILNVLEAEVRIAPGIRLDDVVGNKEACDKMKEYVILPIMFPQLLVNTGIQFLIGKS